jgi:hypothetical protein
MTKRLSDGSAAMWIVLVSALALTAGCGWPGEVMPGTPVTWRAAPPQVALSFDDVASGSLPAGWVVAATNPAGELARWQVVEDPAAASKPRVLKITEIRDGAKAVFNLCWKATPAFRDGTIEVKVRADTGMIDQGGGLIWRAKDARNYYVARYNPLEKNLRLYFVKDGKRTMLAGVPDLDIPAGRWFTLRIAHHGRNIDVALDGRRVLEAQDGTFSDAGGVGFWTKADAASSFDDLKIQGEWERQQS